MDTINVPIEVRASAEGPRLHGVILSEGRAARGGRAELFAPGAVVWPADGIAIRAEHLGPEIARAVPTRDGTEIRVSAPASPDVFQAVKSGRKWMSVEFHAIAESRTKGGIREITRALVDGASLTDDPEYHQTAAEVRTVRRARVWL